MDSFIQEKAPVGALSLIVKLQTSRRFHSSSTGQHLGATIILVWVIAIIVRTEIEIVEGRPAPTPRPTNNFLVVMIIGRSTDGALLPRSVLLSDYQISNSCFVTRIGYTHIHSYRSILYSNKMFSVSTWKVVCMFYDIHFHVVRITTKNRVLFEQNIMSYLEGEIMNNCRKNRISTEVSLKNLFQ